MHIKLQRVDDTTGAVFYQLYVSFGETTAKTENPSGMRSHSGTAL